MHYWDLKLQEKYLRSKKVWIKLEAFQSVYLRVSAFRSGFQSNHEAAFMKTHHRIQDGFYNFSGSPKSRKLVQKIPRCNRFPKPGQTNINLGKFPTNSIWSDPNLSTEAWRHYRPLRTHPRNPTIHQHPMDQVDLLLLHLTIFGVFGIKPLTATSLSV